jgi:hypothetical protein
MMEAIRSSDTSVLTRATRRKIPEDGILHSCRLEHLKSCKGEYDLKSMVLGLLLKQVSETLRFITARIPDSEQSSK